MFLPTCLVARLPTCRSDFAACLSTSLPACLPVGLPTCLPSGPSPGQRHEWSHAAGSLASGCQRDLFPLASLSMDSFASTPSACLSKSRCTPQLHKSLQLANQAILALNKFSGRGHARGSDRVLSQALVDTALRIGERFLWFESAFEDRMTPKAELNYLLTT